MSPWWSKNLHSFERPNPSRHVEGRSHDQVPIRVECRTGNGIIVTAQSGRWHSRGGVPNLNGPIRGCRYNLPSVGTESSFQYRAALRSEVDVDLRARIR